MSYSELGEIDYRASDSLCVIDGDAVIFKCSAAAEVCTIKATHTKSKRSKEFKNITRFRTWLEEQKEKGRDWEEEEFTFNYVQRAEPESYCYHSVKSMINTIHEQSGCEDVLVALDGGNNFRDELPLPFKYKGNREGGRPRPLLLQGAKEYVIKTFPHELSTGDEADAILTQCAYYGYKNNLRWVQATPDKDARATAGWLFNFDKDKYPERIDEALGDLEKKDSKVTGWGRKWFYHQVLFGDMADGYKGSQLAGVRFGEVASYDLLKPCETDKQCWQVIYDKYFEWYGSRVDYTTWDGKEVSLSIFEFINLYVDLAHMARWKGDKLNVKEIMDKLGVEYAKDLQ